MGSVRSDSPLGGAMVRPTAGLGAERPGERPDPTAIVVGSGKGGVGKSVLSVMLGSAFARTGRQVLLLDGVQNLGNLHVLLGLRPAVHLDALLSGEVHAAELVTPVSENLWLVPGNAGAASVYALSTMDRARLHVHLSTLYDHFDIVIVDAGPGIDGVVRVSTIRASGLVIVMVAEPSALSDACALIRIIQLQVPSLPIGVITNRTLSDDEGEAAFAGLRQASHCYRRGDLEYLGAVPEDAAMRDAIHRPERLLEAGAPIAAAAVRRIVAERFCHERASERPWCIAEEIAR